MMALHVAAKQNQAGRQGKPRKNKLSFGGNGTYQILTGDEGEIGASIPKSVALSAWLALPQSFPERAKTPFQAFRFAIASILFRLSNSRPLSIPPAAPMSRKCWLPTTDRPIFSRSINGLAIVPR
jgi:hypothetical protein